MPASPFVDAESLYIYFEKDGVTLTEHLVVPFSAMRRVVFKGANVPERLQDAFKGQEPLRIEREDGYLIILADALWVEIDPAGNVTKQVRVDGLFFRTGGQIEGKPLRLVGFGGTATSGGPGDFFVALDETHSIEFE
ncbi:MAG: hypothetical protein KKB13_28760 [Chloroflexi bacterium]|nr:hypothetical protein [Chloroflexota bacterium]